MATASVEAPIDAVLVDRVPALGPAVRVDIGLADRAADASGEKTQDRVVRVGAVVIEKRPKVVPGPRLLVGTPGGDQVFWRPTKVTAARLSISAEI